MQRIKAISDDSYRANLMDVNTSPVPNPQWTGAPGECAIVVSRGEPRRTDIQMELAVAEQMRNYLLHFTDEKPSELLLAITTQLIAEDGITPVGRQNVELTREHVLAYLVWGRKRLSELEAGDV